MLGHAREQLQNHREFLLVVSVDRGRDGGDHLLVDVGFVREVDDLGDVLVGNVHVLELLVLDLDGDPVHIEVEDRRLLVAGGLLFDVEDARDGDVVAGGHPTGDVVFEVDVDALWRLAAPQALGALLDAHLLGVDELGLVEVDVKRSLPLTALALVRFLEAAVRLGDVGHRPAALALEGRLGDLRPDVGRLPDDSLDRDHPADVVVVDPNAPDIDRLGEVRQADVRAPEFDVGGEVVEAQRLLGVLAYLVGFLLVVLG